VGRFSKRPGDGGSGDRPAGGRAAFLGALREAVSGGTAFGSRTAVPPGRAERLGMAVADPSASTALALPLEFLRLGDDRRAGAELEGRDGGLASRVFEFTADEAVGARGDSVGGWSTFAYHVAAIELGFSLPWFAVAVRRTPSPSQQLYPGRRGQALGTGHGRGSRSYVLHAADPGAARALLGGPLDGWLVGALALRIDNQALVAVEVSGGWAMAAIQAGGLAVPDVVALSRQARQGHPGPWPDALLALLRNFRDQVPPTHRG
jgi:hypothetical protein